MSLKSSSTEAQQTKSDRKNLSLENNSHIRVISYTQLLKTRMTSVVTQQSLNYKNDFNSHMIVVKVQE